MKFVYLRQCGDWVPLDYVTGEYRSDSWQLTHSTDRRNVCHRCSMLWCKGEDALAAQYSSKSTMSSFVIGKIDTYDLQHSYSRVHSKFPSIRFQWLRSGEEKQVVSWDFNDSLSIHSGSEYIGQTLTLVPKNWASLMGNSSEFVDLIYFSETKVSFGWCSLARIGRKRCFSLQHHETWASRCIDLILVIDRYLKRQSVLLSVSFSRCVLWIFNDDCLRRLSFFSSSPKVNAGEGMSQI